MGSTSVEVPESSCLVRRSHPTFWQNAPRGWVEMKPFCGFPPIATIAPRLGFGMAWSCVKFWELLRMPWNFRELLQNWDISCLCSGRFLEHVTWWENCSKFVRGVVPRGPRKFVQNIRWDIKNGQRLCKCVQHNSRTIFGGGSFRECVCTNIAHFPDKTWTF